MSKLIQSSPVSGVGSVSLSPVPPPEAGSVASPVPAERDDASGEGTTGTGLLGKTNGGAKGGGDLPSGVPSDTGGAAAVPEDDFAGEGEIGGLCSGALGTASVASRLPVSATAEVARAPAFGSAATPPVELVSAAAGVLVAPCALGASP